MLADMIISYFNTAVHVYSASGAFTVAEDQIIDKLIGTAYTILLTKITAAQN